MYIRGVLCKDDNIGLVKDKINRRQLISRWSSMVQIARSQIISARKVLAIFHIQALYAKGVAYPLKVYPYIQLIRSMDA